MKKINLKGISEILTQKEMKNVMGGSASPGTNGFPCWYSSACISGSCVGAIFNSWGQYVRPGVCA